MPTVDKTINLSTDYSSAFGTLELCLTYNYYAGCQMLFQGGVAIAPAENATVEITKIEMYVMLRGETQMVDVTDVLKAAVSDVFWNGIEQEIVADHGSYRPHS